MQYFSSLMGDQKVLPLIQVNSAEDGVAVAKAMYEAGLHCVEVLLRTPESFNALREIKVAFPALKVGAGTVVNVPMFDKSVEFGADFIVTPALTPRLVKCLVDSDLPCLPGVSTTADIALAHEAGFTEMKLFPAELSGGVSFLKAVSSVFQKVQFCPTGGVKPENKQAYFDLANVFAVGGSWVARPEWVEQKNWEMIRKTCVTANIFS